FCRFGVLHVLILPTVKHRPLDAQTRRLPFDSRANAGNVASICDEEQSSHLWVATQGRADVAGACRFVRQLLRKDSVPDVDQTRSGALVVRAARTACP